MEEHFPCCCTRHYPLLVWKPSQRKSWLYYGHQEAYCEEKKGLSKGQKENLDRHWTRYRDNSNCVRQQTRKDHMSYVSLMTRNPKSFWQWIKNIKAPKSIIPAIVHRGQTANSDAEKTDIFNNFFRSMFTSALADLKGQLL